MHLQIRKRLSRLFGGGSLSPPNGDVRRSGSSDRLPPSNQSFSQPQDVDRADANPPAQLNGTPGIIPKINLPEQDSSSGNLPHPNISRSRSPSIAPAPLLENELNALSPLSVQCSLSLAQVVVEIAPVPCIGPLLSVLTLVFQAVERSKVNKEQWKLLQGRCVMVMRIASAQVSNYGFHHYPGLEAAAQMLDQTLHRIAERVKHYNEMDGILALFQFQAISEVIRGLFGELDTCLGMFSYATDIAQLQWVGEFRAVQEREIRELQQLHIEMKRANNSLDTIGQNQDQLLARTSQLVDTIQDVLNAKSVILESQSTTTVDNYVDAQQIVRTILSVTQLQLPPKLLLGKQCILDTTIPIKTGVTCDIYSASFLGGEKVAKKVFRIGMSDQEFVRRYAERFLRIASLWSEFRSDYTLPFYGIGMESFEGDSHFQLYMVSPLMKNFDAITYVNKYRNNPGMKKNILRIITDTARGLQYLHNRNPPVVHSGMRGNNVLVTDSGGGIVGGFGLTKALESVGNDKIPPAVMTGKTESQRWMAPEMFAEEPPLQTPCDVWGWAMTALEIISGSIPYHTHKQAMTIMIKVTEGPPKRKDHLKFQDYAYRPEEMWDLLEKCWSHEPEKRLNIDQVVVRLKEIKQLSE